MSLTKNKSSKISKGNLLTFFFSNCIKKVTYFPQLIINCVEYFKKSNTNKLISENYYLE